ncbi:hypothetical protein AWB76_00901 [Caballeronia temeraria]|uniref:Uncharacterized protein n=1 Tax=Caballeronia temeraria TaxID=1777137 RepID=A0A157ZLK7_9BURK|nr:hypothetical protein [Caballeronia temeraria]SAK46383.1 hypothetical protein AWB76_00901 [Caballeronia temeraria]
MQTTYICTIPYIITDQEAPTLGLVYTRPEIEALLHKLNNFELTLFPRTGTYRRFQVVFKLYDEVDVDALKSQFPQLEYTVAE